MKLFVIDNAATQTQLYNTLKVYYGVGSWSTLWVDGRKATDGKWYYYSYGTKTSAFTGLTWYTTAGKANGCLIACSYTDKWTVDGSPCSTSMYHICEYKK